jgi:RimJ/RimL family protein N-acetyltransferase
VALRPPRHVDAPAVAAACRDPEIHRWTFIPQPYRLEDAQGWIAVQETAREGGESLALLVVDARDDALLGAVGLTVRSREHDRVEIGYWTAAEARGRGVATTGVRLVSRWALGALGARRVELLPFVGNDASCRVAERAGYRREGIMRAYFVHGGRPVDAIMYSLVADGGPPGAPPRA